MSRPRRSPDLALPAPQPVGDALLRRWPLPPPPSGGKEQRGRVLVVAGSSQMPGAAILAGTAALRAGAGKLVIATSAATAGVVALAVPEARVIGLHETGAGGFEALSARTLPADCDAVLIGPGLQDEAATCAFANAYRRHAPDTPLILDAAAMAAAEDVGGELLLTPHSGELAHLWSCDARSIMADPCAAAGAAAVRWQAVVALKAAVTHIVNPQRTCWRHDRGNAGLGISGSGDVLAGLIAGLAARGAALAQAAVWGVALHARAGEALAARQGVLGYLAREIAGEVPRLMQELGPA